MKKTQHRVEYEKYSLSEQDINRDPFIQFKNWWQDAKDANVHSLDAASLSTVDHDLRPDARIVLIKGFDERGVVFFTNYESKKSKQLEQNPNACLVIFWPEVERQIRIRGRAQESSREESLEYFTSRPRGAQIGAWASSQSHPLNNREELERNFFMR